VQNGLAPWAVSAAPGAAYSGFTLKGTHMYPDQYPYDYQRLRDEAKRHAMQLRQEAIREAHAWMARGIVRMTRRVFHSLRTPSAPTTQFTPEAPTPCQPSF